MAWVSPNVTNALSAGFQGQDLAEQMRQRATATQAQQMALRQAEEQRQAQALVGQLMQELMKGQGASAIPIPQPRGGAAAPGAATMPAPAGTPQVPQAAGVSPLAPIQGQGGAVADQIQQRALQPPARPGGVVDDVPEPSGPALTWPGIMASLQKVAPDASPQIVAQVANQMAPLVLANQKERYEAWKATQDFDLKKQAQLDRLFINQQNLDFKYATASTPQERMAIKELQMANQRAIAELTAGSRERVAAGNNATRLEGIDRTNRSREVIANLNATSRESIATDKLTLQKELGERRLDLDSSKLEETAAYHKRVLELREKGLDLQDAQARAKLDMTLALAQLRDDTTRRGQDLVHDDRVAAESGRMDRFTKGLDAKQQAAMAKALPALDGALADLDMLTAKAKELIVHPGLDAATGPLDQRVPTWRDDTADFEENLRSLKSELGFAALANMRQLSPTGGALGNVSNFEVKELQAKIAGLGLGQSEGNMRKNLAAIVDYASASKKRLLDAYQTQYKGGKAAPAATGVPAAPSDGASIPTPESLANEPDGTVFKMGGKTYTKRGANAVETPG